MQQVRGLILAPVPRTHEYLRRYAAGLPIVMVDRAVETGSYDTVRVDDRAVARAAVEHLVRHGHRRVAFVGEDEAFATARDRLAGYQDVLAEYGVRPDPGLRRPGPPNDDDAVPVLRELTALPDPRPPCSRPTREPAPGWPTRCTRATGPSWRSSASATSRCPSRCARR